jgi:hypothetical protein
MSTEPSREARLRRLARRQGFGLARKARKPGAYWIFDRSRNRLIGGKSGLSLDEVEEWLTNPEVGR